ncbi:DUF2306 domain-containing protein [Archangium lansingense]|uniref:DUF2306 domain-containing protein n=1 Tax=Archangium lansingense TaxID=2995310 RepID=A0ABT4AFH4_9BACT|nr:DUF2306 domain-containing protein [Archangium lansinium]MCY1080380.1 DUF2306 domain-containing protein [Archangium lansinium]
MARKTLWTLFASLCLAVGLYPGIYLFEDRNFGLLKTKTSELLADTAWNAAFYTHIALGGVALAIGWTQFASRLRNRSPGAHRLLGKLYVGSVLPSALMGIYLGFFATGGVSSSAGFVSLGLIWFYTTMSAYRFIKNGQIEEHRLMMTYSYAACFAAVTLRIWLPLLTPIAGEFVTAYRIVAWLCWIPNLAIAHLITRRQLRAA